MPAKAIEELSEIEVVGTSLLPGLEIEEEKLPYEVRSFDSENIGNETSLGITDVLNQSVLVSLQMRCKVALIKET